MHLKISENFPVSKIFMHYFEIYAYKDDSSVIMSGIGKLRTLNWTSFSSYTIFYIEWK